MHFWGLTVSHNGTWSGENHTVLMKIVVLFGVFDLCCVVSFKRIEASMGQMSLELCALMVGTRDQHKLEFRAVLFYFSRPVRIWETNWPLPNPYRRHISYCNQTASVLESGYEWILECKVVSFILFLLLQKSQMQIGKPNDVVSLWSWLGVCSATALLFSLPFIRPDFTVFHGFRLGTQQCIQFSTGKNATIRPEASEPWPNIPIQNWEKLISNSKGLT